MDEDGDSIFIVANLPNDTDPGTGEYTFDMPSAPMVLFAQYDFDAATSEDTGQGVVTVEFDEQGAAVVTAEPKPGFEFAGWLVNDQPAEGDSDGFVFDTFGDGDTLTATFEADTLPDAVWNNSNWVEANWQ